MAPFSSILCALDFSDLAPRVLKHAAGLAGACGARLTVLTVVGGDVHGGEATLDGLVRDLLPAGAAYGGEPRMRVVRLTQGQPADAILEMAREETDIIVAGTHGKSGVSRWLLGSTSAMVLESTTCPTLLVPPGSSDIVTLGPAGATLHPGTVLVPVDLTEHNQAQLDLASQLAALARQPLVAMTVTSGETRDEDAERALRDRTAGPRPRAGGPHPGPARRRRGRGDRPRGRFRARGTRRDGPARGRARRPRRDRVGRPRDQGRHRAGRAIEGVSGGGVSGASPWDELRGE